MDYRMTEVIYDTELTTGKNYSGGEYRDDDDLITSEVDHASPRSQPGTSGEDVYYLGVTQIDGEPGWFGPIYLLEDG